MNVFGELASVALGSNLGDRKAYLCAGLRGLAATPRTSLLSLSRVYETEPMGPADQGPYLNAVVRVATERRPHNAAQPAPSQAACIGGRRQCHGIVTRP